MAAEGDRVVFLGRVFHSFAITTEKAFFWSDICLISEGRGTWSRASKHDHMQRGRITSACSIICHSGRQGRQGSWDPLWWPSRFWGRKLPGPWLPVLEAWEKEPMRGGGICLIRHLHVAPPPHCLQLHAWSQKAERHVTEKCLTCKQQWITNNKNTPAAQLPAPSRQYISNRNNCWVYW